MKLFEGFYSDIGTTRKVNQDSIVCRKLEQKKNSFAVVAVCDGIGGLERGEVASEIISECINETFEQITEWIEIDSANSDVIILHIKDAVDEANERLYNYRIANGVQMGTTMSLLIIIRDMYYIIQVGDSRTYLYRDGFLQQLTVDASVSMMINGKMKAYLDNYMGKDINVWYTISEGMVMPEDLFIVCCDGFYHQLKTEDLIFNRREFYSVERANKKCKELVHEMMKRGERDNISVGMIYAKK